MQDLLIPSETARLNDFVRGRTIESIEYDHGDDLTLRFTDGAVVRLSTLGGVEIEDLLPPA